jgi:acetoin utilization deacetylase AcuC-like enzyme
MCFVVLYLPQIATRWRRNANHYRKYMIKVFYTPKQNAEPGIQQFKNKSPSAYKPKQVAAALRGFPGVEFVEPRPLPWSSFALAHHQLYVDGIFDMRVPNGFGTKSQSVNDSLPYTTGAMYDAACHAAKDSPTCALVSGFHHAGYKGWEGFGWFCTFNGLMIAAAKLLDQTKIDPCNHVAIVDCDQHWGNGTDDIMHHIPLALANNITHLSFGQWFHKPEDAATYLAWLAPGGVVEEAFKKRAPDVVLYQAGADVHKDDPYGGVFTTPEIMERDRRFFTITKKLGIPVAWNLAGGYQIAEDGSIDKVIEIHLNTFRACQEIYGE